MESIYRSDVILVQTKIDKCRQLLRLPLTATAVESTGVTLPVPVTTRPPPDDSEFKKIAEEVVVVLEDAEDSLKLWLMLLYENKSSARGSIK